MNLVHKMGMLEKYATSSYNKNAAKFLLEYKLIRWDKIYT